MKKSMQNKVAILTKTDMKCSEYDIICAELYIDEKLWEFYYLYR